MDMKDWFSAGSVVIGASTLFVSLRNLSWTRRMKGADLRSEMLIVMVGNSAKIRQSQALLAKATEGAELLNNIALFKAVHDAATAMQDIAESQAKAETLLLAIRPEHGIDAYAAVRHLIEECRLSVERNYDALVSIEARIKVLGS